MALEGQNEGIRKLINELEVLAYLRKNPGAKLAAVDIKTNMPLHLVLNSNGQLCYQEGPSKKLIEPKMELVLLTEIPAEPSAPLEITPAVPSSIWSDADYRRIAMGINALIDSATAQVIPDLVVEDVEYDEAEEEDYPWVDGNTTFALIAPSTFWPDKLAEEYFNAVIVSLNALYEEMIKEGKNPRKVTTEGLIFNVPAVRKRFQRLLEEKGLRFNYLDRRRGYTYRKIRIWEVLIEQENDNDIPF